MNNYAAGYFDLIYKKLNHMEVTDRKGTSLSADEGLAIWAERAQQVKEKTKGLIFFCGNGASASMAEHMSHDWFQNAEINTTTCAEISHVTAISNDISYEDVYAYRIRRIISERDIVVGISSSGNSPNIVKAISTAEENGAFTITLSGKNSDNKIRGMGDLNFYVPLETYGEVESAHAVLLHGALDYFLDQYMGGRH